MLELCLGWLGEAGCTGSARHFASLGCFGSRLLWSCKPGREPLQSKLNMSCATCWVGESRMSLRNTRFSAIAGPSEHQEEASPEQATRFIHSDPSPTLCFYSVRPLDPHRFKEPWIREDTSHKVQKRWCFKALAWAQVQLAFFNLESTQRPYEHVQTHHTDMCLGTYFRTSRNPPVDSQLCIYTSSPFDIFSQLPFGQV